MKNIYILMALGLYLSPCQLYAGSINQKPEKYHSFRPGKIWNDTDGKPIEAHGGGMFCEKGTCYWFGEHGTPGRTKIGVMCYSSKDLYNWKNEGVALPLAYDDPNHELAIGCALERPKVIYNAATKKYVMWFHLELKGQGYDSARSGVAVSDRVTGPYTFLRSFRPNNSMARHFLTSPNFFRRCRLLICTPEIQYLRRTELVQRGPVDFQEVWLAVA